MGRARLIRNLLGSIAVLSAVAAIGIGLPAVNAAVPAARPVPAGRRYPLGAGVSVLPPPGATLDVTHTRPGTDRGTALFLLGGVRYVLIARPFAGSLEQAAAALRKRITGMRGYQVAGPETPDSTAAGVPGRKGGYASPGRVGQYAVFLSGGTAVEVTIAGAGPDLRTALAVLEASVASIRFPVRE